MITAEVLMRTIIQRSLWFSDHHIFIIITALSYHHSPFITFRLWWTGESVPEALIKVQQQKIGTFKKKTVIL